MYFDNMKTVDEIKDRFKILAKRLHPDVGGDKIIMQEINNEYDIHLKRIINQKEEKVFFDEVLHKIKKVIEWAENNQSFDLTFINSLHDRISQGRDLTEAQENALDNIIRKFKIKVTKD